MGRGGGWRRRSGSGDESVETCPATTRSAHTARGSTAGDGGGGGGRKATASLEEEEVEVASSRFCKLFMRRAILTRRGFPFLQLFWLRN